MMRRQRANRVQSAPVRQKEDVLRLDGKMDAGGSLDDEAPINPQARIFSGSRAGWSCADDGLPAYPEYAPQ